MTVAQPVYYTLFVSSCLRVPFGPTSLPEVPPPTSAPLKHWNLFVLSSLFFFLTLGGGQVGCPKEDRGQESLWQWKRTCHYQVN